MAWALIAASAIRMYGSEVILAASFAITSDCENVESVTVETLALAMDGDEALFTGEGDLLPGFYLWEGAVHFDGVDEVSYDGRVRKLAAAEVFERLLAHESGPPQDSAETAEGWSSTCLANPVGYAVDDDNEGSDCD